MKKILVGFLCLSLLAGCGTAIEQETPAEETVNTLSWQEQYDLGLRYLFDGNYQEAIIAFTAAIEIDAKRTEAYIGAADAYMGLSESDSAIEILESALAVDNKVPEIYIKFSDIYISRGDYQAAADILSQGLEATGSEELQNVLNSVWAYLSESGQALEVSNAHISFHALDAIRGQISLAIDNMPLMTKVWQEEEPEDDSLDNWTTVSFSDGEKTFTIGIMTDRTETETYEIYFPQDSAVQSVFMVYYLAGEEEGFRWLELEDCAVTRSGNTLQWNFNMPKWGFDLRDTKYVGYDFRISLSEEWGKDYRGRGVFEIADGAMTPLSDVERVEDFGYCITEEQLEAFQKEANL